MTATTSTRTTTSRRSATARREMVTAVHEAGHLVAGWLLGAFPKRIALAEADGLTPEDRRGRRTQAQGDCDVGLYDNVIPDEPAYERLSPAMLREARRYGMAAAAMTMAGPISEARYTRVPLVVVLLTFGSGDERHIAEIGRDLYADPAERRAFAHEAAELARKLLRKRMPAIITIAEQLFVARLLETEHLEPLLERLIGLMPDSLEAVP